MIECKFKWLTLGSAGLQAVCRVNGAAGSGSRLWFCICEMGSRGRGDKPGCVGAIGGHSLSWEASVVDEGTQGHQILTAACHLSCVLPRGPGPEPLVPSPAPGSSWLSCAALCRPWGSGAPRAAGPPGSEVGALLWRDPFLSLTRWPHKPTLLPGRLRDGWGCHGHHSHSVGAAEPTGQAQGPR